MPFASKAQQRAAFAGAIPGFSKKRARAWAAETDFDSIPERAKKAVALRRPGRLLAALYDAHDAMNYPGTAKDAYLAHKEHHERRSRPKHAELEASLVKLCGLMNVRPPSIKPVAATTARTSQTMRSAVRAQQVGEFSGMAPRTLPGPAASSQAVNPRKSLRTAVTPTTTKAIGSPRAMPGT